MQQLTEKPLKVYLQVSSSSNSCKNTVLESLSPYGHKLSHFHDPGMRFKGGWRLYTYFIAVWYWSTADSKQLL